ncbi:tRNA (34-2'-O)-methyltransferase regulator WDR6 [Neosynchiropus ocellatus]
MEIQIAALVAPVTAVEFLRSTFLLTGEGPVLTVYALRPRPKTCTTLSVLQHYRIHGIRPQSSRTGETSGCGQSLNDLAVFGGKAVQHVRLHLDDEEQQFEMLSPLIELDDWVLDARWLPDNRLLLCVAVAHNGALLLDVTTGSVTARHSCEEGCLLYSALLIVHRFWPDTIVIGGTVFNQLVLWKPEENGGDQHKAPVARRLLGHRGVIFSISYLQEEGLLASASDDRSVRVWAVGALGGPGGEFGDLNPTCLRVLYGHQARVFSVHLSPGKAFSAGEDGACIVWDLAEGGTVFRTLKGHRAGGIRALAVSTATCNNSNWVASGGADGGVRLWQVAEGQEKKEETSEKLSDLTFSGLGTPKVVCLTGERKGWRNCEFVVCTDSGVVYIHRAGEWEMLWQGSPDFQSYCLMTTVSVKCSTGDVDLCAVGSLSGAIWVFLVSQPHSGILLSAGTGKTHSLIWQRGGTRVHLLASGAEGLVYRWSFGVTVNDGSLHLNTLSLRPFLLPPCAKRWLTAAVLLQPQSSWVCGDRRGSLLLFEEGVDSAEGYMEGKQTQPLKPLSVLFGVHGKAGVTSVCEYQGLLYSTGRDGCVRVFRVRPSLRADSEGRWELEVLRVQRACKGMEWLETVLFLSPEEVGSNDEVVPEDDTNNSRETRFVIVGFHAAHFVVWDPVRQERLMSVPCGGGHRSWSLWPFETGVWPGYGALVFIKQGSVMASRPPVEMLNWAEEKPGGLGLREGIHGRGIGCVCRLGRVGAEEGHWEVIATGGEDTSVAILAVHPKSGALKVLSVITDHISSVRTMVAVKKKENQPLSVLLVSASGRAQIHCYRILVCLDALRVGLTCQVIQVGRHRLDELWERRRNRHKMVKMDPEPRYMSIAVVGEKDGCVLVALACSDGAIRLFSICEAQRKVHLLWETFHHQRCVLSVATCSLEDGQGNRCALMFSAATDGKLSVWRLPSPMTDAPTTPCFEVPTHQSGVNEISLWMEDSRKDDSCLLTVASGGDDGQLTVVRIRVLYFGDSPFQLHLLGQSSVPLAHASPLTALKILKPGLVVTTSSDQRVCFWKVSSTRIGHVGALCSHVADAAGLAVWQGEDPNETDTQARDAEGDSQIRHPELGHQSSEEGLARGWVLVCGQGFQLLRVLL